MNIFNGKPVLADDRQQQLQGQGSPGIARVGQRLRRGLLDQREIVAAPRISAVARFCE